jgi:hypothetical protein
LESCKLEKPDDGLVYSLLHAEYLWGDHSLFEEYRSKVQALLQRPICRERKSSEEKNCRNSIEREDCDVSYGRFWANAQFKRNLKVFEKYFVRKEVALEDEKKILKDAYLKLLLFILMDLNLYSGYYVSDIASCREKLVDNRILNPLLVHEIEGFIREIQNARNKMHFLKGEQDDSIDEKNELVRKLLREIECRVLRPFYESLSNLKYGIGIFIQSFFERRLYYRVADEKKVQARRFKLSESPEPTIRLIENQNVALKELTSFSLSGDWQEKLFDKNGKTRNCDEFGVSRIDLSDEYCVKLVTVDYVSSGNLSHIKAIFVLRDSIVPLLSRCFGECVLPCGMFELFEFISRPSYFTSV